MRTLFTSFLLVAILSITGVAQPQIAYIIPDIGAAGMNSYVEIVAPIGATGTFGGNGLFVNTNNGSETIGIGPANLADTSRIVVGPIVVSWGARLISTQIFVKPGAATGIIPLRVTVGAQSTTVDFEIVVPQTLGAAGVLNGGGALGSGGVLGTRSKRGAMIVNSMVLGTGVYTANTGDPDPGTAGNQAYLPLIIISRGNVAVLPGASLSLIGVTSDGAVGGGGGGGRICDATIFNSNPGNGTVGGAGYSGGGGGGKNGSGNFQQPPGASTGTGGNGLSGSVRGTNSYECSNPESAGGGSGHPFGSGGGGSCNNAGSLGGNGGGGGNGQNAPGGGGGFGTAGANAAGSSTNGGRVHGNAQGVPVAGGSGGASANPQILAGGCGGAGGGGGGAIVLYSMTLMNGSSGGYDAHGGDGDGSPRGGGGSGGYIGVGAKILSSFGGSGNVAGGAGGGAGGGGRARYDGFTTSAPTFSGGGSTSIGPTIDTLSYVQGKTFTLQGSYDGANTPVIYMRGLNGVWAPQAAPTTTGRVWTLPLTINDGSGLHYFVALQPVPGANPSGQFDAQPSFIFSQAAANIIQIDLIPKIAVDSTVVTFSDVPCTSPTFDSVIVSNTGDATLNVTPSIAGANAADFSILAPLGPFTVAPAASVTIRLRFSPATPGAKVAQLVLTNNDPRPGKNPTNVDLFGRRQNLTRSLDSARLDFGGVCVDSVLVRSNMLRVNGETGGTITSITRLGGGAARFVVTAPATPFPFPAGVGAIPIQVRFQPNAPGNFADSFLVVTGPCNDSLKFRVIGSGIVTQLTVTPDTLDFGDVRITTSSTLQAILKNIGTRTDQITSIFITPGGTAFTLPTPPVNAPIAVGATLPVDVRFSPTVTGPAQARLCVVFGTMCPDTVCIELRGRGVTSLLLISRRSLQMDADSCLATPPAVTDTFTLYNRGTAPVRINSAVVASGNVTVTSAPALPFDLPANDSILFTVSWLPGVTGTDKITISTEAEDPTQKIFVVDVALRRERSLVELVDSVGGLLPGDLDLGNLFPCTASRTIDVILRNSGTTFETITGGFLMGAPFTASPAPPYNLAPGGSQRITLRLAPGSTGTFNDTLVLLGGCGREIRQAVHGSSFTLNFRVTGINFGTSNVGLTRTGTARIENISTTPNNVKAIVDGVTIIPAAGSPFVVTASSFPDTLAPGEGSSIEVSFTPTAETGYSAQICFHISQPCDTTICVPINGIGVQSNVLVRKNTLDFGTKYLCQDTILQVDIENTGSAPLNLQSLGIVGADAIAFEFVSPVSTPTVIAQGGSVTVAIRFIPGRSPGDGTKNAALEIRTDDLAQPLITVRLIGERRRQLLATPLSLDFGRVVVGTTVEDTVTLENRTSVPLQIASFSVPPPFQIVGFIPGGAPPLMLQPGDSILVRISFTPVDSSQVSADLVAAETLPCVDTTRIAVTGSGKIIRDGRVSIVIPTILTGKPGDRLAIPIILESSQFIAESEATTFRATVRFKASLLVPQGVRSKGQPLAKLTAGRLMSSKIVAGERIVTLEITNNPVPTAPDTLGFLDVLVALGDTIATPIVIDSLTWTDGSGKVTSTTSNGFFMLDSICTTGGNRLVRSEGGFGITSIRPNPFNPSTDIIFETNESGATSLGIYDLYGNLVEKLVDREELTPLGIHTQRWNADGYPSGIYYAILTSPTQRTAQRLVLIK